MASTNDKSLDIGNSEDIDIVDGLGEAFKKAHGIVILVMEGLRDRGEGNTAEVGSLWAVQGFIEDAQKLSHELWERLRARSGHSTD